MKVSGQIPPVLPQHLPAPLQADQSAGRPGTPGLCSPGTFQGRRRGRVDIHYLINIKFAAVNQTLSTCKINLHEQFKLVNVFKQKCSENVSPASGAH